MGKIAPMTETKHYTGGCHCGRVRFEARADLSKPVLECNCSICGKSGMLLAFVPQSDFKFISGEDALVDYQFYKKQIHHAFCPTCGIHPFSYGTAPDGSTTYAVNVRCLDDVDPSTLTRQFFDGKSL